MNTQRVLSRAVQVTAFLFAAFGGFLKDFAPPDPSTTRFTLGIGSFFALFVLLWIAGYQRFRSRRSHRNLWLLVSAISIAIAGGIGYLYEWHLTSVTFIYPPQASGKTQQLYVGGDILTADAKEYIAQTGRGVPETVAAFGGVEFLDRVWSANSIRRSRLCLAIEYTILLLALSTSIFSLTEGILVSDFGE